jgi:hypothetical protein
MRASAGAFRHVCGFDDVPSPPDRRFARRTGVTAAPPVFAPPQPLLETARLETGRDGTEYILKNRLRKIGGSADISMRECKAGVLGRGGGVASSRIR